MLSTLLSELRAVKPAVWAVVAGLAATTLFLYKHQDWRLHEKLYERGVHAAGTVTSKDLVGGKKIEYSFRVGEKTYRGESTDGYGNPPFARLSPDDEVIVFYLPEDPSVSIMGDPKLRVEDQHRWMAWSLLIFAAPIIVALAGELKKHE